MGHPTGSDPINRHVQVTPPGGQLPADAGLKYLNQSADTIYQISRLKFLIIYFNYLAIRLYGSITKARKDPG